MQCLGAGRDTRLQLPLTKRWFTCCDNTVRVSVYATSETAAAVATIMQHQLNKAIGNPKSARTWERTKKRQQRPADGVQ